MDFLNVKMTLDSCLVSTEKNEVLLYIVRWVVNSLGDIVSAGESLILTDLGDGETLEVDTELLGDVSLNCDDIFRFCCSWWAMHCLW